MDESKELCNCHNEEGCKCGCGAGNVEFPKELNRFNWGAFLLNWIWGIMHRKYITLLYFPACLIPIVGPLAVSIWFGIAGNKWAWQSRSWTSIEEFNRVQCDWIRAWLVLTIFGIIITFKIFFFLVYLTNLEA